MPVGSLEAPQSKRPRAGSVSGRLRSASDLCEDGTISQNQKGLVKDMIISGDPELARALGEYEKGNSEPIKKLLNSGVFNRRSSIDLVAELGMEQMDLNIFDFDDEGLVGGDQGFADDLDDMMPFTFYDDPAIGGRGAAASFSIVNDDAGQSSRAKDNHNSSHSNTNNHNSNNSGSNWSGGNSFNNSMMNKERRRSNRERTFSQIFDGPTGGENLFGEIGDDAVNEFRAGQSFSIDGGDEGYGLDFYGTSPKYKNRAPSFSNGSMPGPGGRKNSLVKPNSYAGSFKSKSGMSSAGNSRNGINKFSKANLGNKSKGSNISSSAMNKNKTKKGSYSSSSSGNGKKDTGNGGSYHLKDGGSSNNSHGSSNSGSKPMSIPGKAGSGVKNDENDNKIGIYSPEARRARIARFMAKRKRRIWTKRVKYDVRKNFADSRLRVKGRFVKKEDEELLRELMNMT